jgi:hypothetical protein
MKHGYSLLSLAPGPASLLTLKVSYLNQPGVWQRQRAEKILYFEYLALFDTNKALFFFAHIACRH